MQTAYLNGEFLPLSEARIPVLDRGFLLGDGIYEVMPAYAGTPFLLPAHIKRLKRSLAETRIADTMTLDEWTLTIQSLVDRNGGGDQFIYIQVTRGVQAQRNHRISGEEQPSILAFCQAWPAPPADLAERGIACVLHDDIRWQRCDIKTISLLPNVLLADQATQQGAAETLLIRKGQVGEGATSNLFIVCNGCVQTPPRSSLILHGVTRALVIELAAVCGIPTVENDISVDQLFAADEVMITSSTREIFPVTVVDGKTIGTGTPGKIWGQLYAAYQTHKAQACQS